MFFFFFLCDVEIVGFFNRIIFSKRFAGDAVRRLTVKNGGGGGGDGRRLDVFRLGKQTDCFLLLFMQCFIFSFFFPFLLLQ